jgi:hypothetical protein
MNRLAKYTELARGAVLGNSVAMLWTFGLLVSSSLMAQTGLQKLDISELGVSFTVPADWATHRAQGSGEETEWQAVSADAQIRMQIFAEPDEDGSLYDQLKEESEDLGLRLSGKTLDRDYNGMQTVTVEGTGQITEGQQFAVLMAAKLPKRVVYVFITTPIARQDLDRALLYQLLDAVSVVEKKR